MLSGKSLTNFGTITCNTAEVGTISFNLTGPVPSDNTLSVPKVPLPKIFTILDQMYGFSPGITGVELLIRLLRLSNALNPVGGTNFTKLSLIT